MPRSSGGLAALLGLALVGSAAAAPAYNPDPLTVSGRFNAPKALDGPLKANITVAAVSMPKANADLLGAKLDAVQLAMTTAMARSMGNFGYQAPAPSAQGVTITVVMEPYEVVAEPDGVAVVARMAVAAEGAHADCVPRRAEARFRALAPLQAVGQQRVSAWVAVIGLAAVGLDASQLAVGQLSTAAASDAAVNARRERTEFESVSPDKSEKGMARFAAVNATQLGAADLIRQLGRSACPARGDS